MAFKSKYSIVDADNDIYFCYGESISLKVKSRGETDSEILNKYLGAVREN
jgi:hypothetical protein